jgi:hypothetical protein
MRRPAIVLALLAAAACGPSQNPGASVSADAAVPQVHIAHNPPSAKDVIAAAIASGGVPLTVSTTCANVGTDPSDATIGRYLAGFLAEMSSPDKKNWIDAKVEPGTSDGGEAISICTLTLRHEDGDDRWGWGIRFHVRSSDGLVLPKSFTCVGAG